MGAQEIIVTGLFIIALGYIIRIIYRNLNSKKGCASGCGKCGVDFSGIQPSRPVKEK
ncbi:FeoB-associated Cys-rich membrane protein [Pararcticibacter amylolyticus]|uniref:FeoB-associated Cys-rich membrane protein n=1 Tax=Pararcticibacter amylolyticus TaxID=2173175 RepID=A0A2U2PM49_9SPHI|nr:FeoB-associated Cys-rich membrane protein [Pararcticibacter amylolyticus]PWG82342.1 FeoB-associated Cys-rich membrane protein [Pararcticibacter amylolyticus]